MKKLAMAVATAAVLSSSAIASCASAFTGFYAGAQAGMASTSGKVVNSDGDRTSFGDKSFVGGLFLGYGMGVGSCAYVGGELYGNYDSVNVTMRKDSNSSEKFRNRYNVGAKARLAYTVSQYAMVFLGLGCEYSKPKIKFNAQEVANNSSHSKRNFVFAPSVGTEIYLHKNVFVRGEYTYAIGHKVKLKDKDSGEALGSTKSNNQRFMLGLGYKF